MSAAQWSAARTSLLNLLYPHGLPSTGADVSQANYNYAGAGIALPANCTHMTRYTISAPGQRPGGDPQYTYLLYPTTSNGKLVVWMCGHDGWADYDRAAEGNVIGSLLGAGYYVLVCDTVAFSYAQNPVGTHIVIGGSWTYSSGSWHNTGGTLTAIAEHAVSALDSDGGPLALLQFVHHVIVSANQAVSDVSPSKCILAGHSGGGIAGNLVSALDGRYVSYYSNVPGLVWPCVDTTYVNSDTESYVLSAAYTGGACAIDWWGMFRIGASWPGRHTDLVSALNDEYWPVTRLPAWYEQQDAIVDYIRSVGSTFTYYLDPIAYPGHVMNAARVTRMLSLMAGD